MTRFPGNRPPKNQGPAHRRAKAAGSGKPVPKKLESARDLVADVLARSGFRLADYPVFDAWDRVLGREAALARATGLARGRLTVEVDNHVRLHTLTLRKRELLKKLNAAFSAPGPVSDIIFRLGSSPLSDDNNGYIIQSEGDRPIRFQSGPFRDPPDEIQEAIRADRID